MQTNDQVVPIANHVDLKIKAIGGNHLSSYFWQNIGSALHGWSLSPFRQHTRPPLFWKNA
jgi:hypothetical protein